MIPSELLRGIPPAPAPATLSRGLIDTLLRSARQAHVAAGRTIVAPGSPPSVAVVLAGVVRLSMVVPGGRPVTLRYARPGEMVGLIAALAGVETVTAEAVNDCTLAILSIDDVRRIADTAEVAWQIAEAIAHWTVDALQGLAAIATAPTRARLAAHLLAMATTDPDGSLVAYITHQQLADAVGTVREVVSRSLRGLENDGAVVTERGRIIVRNPTLLGQIAVQYAGGGA